MRFSYISSDHFPIVYEAGAVGTGPKGFPTVREEPLPKQLLRLKAKMSWSWERMCRELHRVMGEEGPSHTTLYRYASGKVKQPNILVERYVQQAIHKLTVELAEKQNRQA